PSDARSASCSTATGYPPPANSSTARTPTSGRTTDPQRSTMAPRSATVDTSADARRSDTEMAFRSHSSYVRAFALEAGWHPGSGHLRGLQNVDAAARGVPPLRPRSTTVDLAQVRRSLVAAWSTELLLATSAELMVDDELIRVANNWAVIQA